MDRIEQRILEIVDRHAGELVGAGNELFCRAERGYAEWDTAALTAEALRNMGLKPREGLAVTGVKAMVGDKPGPVVAVIGELDGILCPEHPHAASGTGMSHACGHNAQLMAMLGAAWALSDPEVAASLDGRAAIFAVPAEEYLNADIRESLEKEHDVRFSGGKSELIRRGEFDDVDIALTTHVHMAPGKTCDLLLGNNAASGFIGKTVTIRGKAAHAAMAPHEGVNALNAAALGLSALGMVRETFQEKDYVRVHPIMKRGGDAVNVVPQEALLDMMVRAKTIEAIDSASRKVDRAFEGAAHALGATAVVKNAQGYMPVIERPADRVLLDAAEILRQADGGVTVETIEEGYQNAASTDAGDLTHIMPVLNFTFGGAKGALHSRDFVITDENAFYILPAKLLALTTYRLLRDGAKEAKAIRESFKPVFTKQAYIDYIETMHS